MRIKPLLLFICLLVFQEFCGAKKKEELIICIDLENYHSLVKHFEMQESDLSFENVTLNENRPSPLFRFFHVKNDRNKKLTAAALAFPLPFGIVGLHRIYLGSAPYVPVVYIASFGGVLGFLPLIDFCFILLDKNTEKFSDNKKVFMWVN